MKLAIMRHGETEWNRLHKLQGQSDTELNANGIAMAQQARETYQNEPWTRCFCSPLRRARRTAELCTEGHGLELVEDDRLKEMSFGQFEGDLNIVGTPGHPLIPLFEDPEHFQAVGGSESFDEVFARTADFLREHIAPLCETEEYVLIVGHGAMNLTMMNRIRRKPLSHFWDTHRGNCEVELFEISSVEELHLDENPRDWK